MKLFINHPLSKDGSKTDKTFPPKVRRGSQKRGSGRNYRRLRFPSATQLRGGGVERWRKENFMRRIVRRIFKKSFHPLCATLPRRRGNARRILQFSGGEGSLPAFPPRHEARKFELIKRLPYDSNSPRKYDGDSWMRHQLLKFFHRVEREWNYFCSLRFNGKCLENIDENKKSIRKFIKLIKLAHKNKN